MRARGLLLVLPLVALVGIVGTATLAGGPPAERSAHASPASGRCSACHAPGDLPAGANMAPHPAPWAMAAAADGRSLFVAAPGTNRVEEIDVAGGRVVRRLGVEGRARGLAVSPDGTHLAVSLNDRNQILWIDARTGRGEARMDVGRAPAGLAFGAGGTRLFVANMVSHDVSVLDVARAREIRRLPAGREPFVVTAAPDGQSVAVVSRRTELAPPGELPFSLVTLIDPRTLAVRRVVRLPSCHMAEGAAFTKDGAHLLVPALLTRNRLPILQVERGWVMSSVLAVIEVATGDVRLLPLTGPDLGFPDPSGIALSPDGREAYVASAGRDVVGIIDVPALLATARQADASQRQHLSWTRRYLRRCVSVHANPRGVLFLPAPSGPRLAVAERLADSVALLSLGELGDLVDPVDLAAPSAGDRVRRVPLAHAGHVGAVQRGARNFHSARYAFQQAFSCRSCHPDGHTDGLTYDFDIDGVGRNVVLNRSLRGVAGTAPFKWIGLNPSLERQCGARFASVLTRADPMGKEELQDLVAYLHSLPPPPPDPSAGRVGGADTGAVARGKRIFERAMRKDGSPIGAAGRCITCHPPPHYTSRLRADVGTRGPLDKTGLFDVPHLTGIGSKAPYLHDGRALSLEAIWTAPGVGDTHGVVSDLGKADLNDLVEYLKGL